MSEMGTDERIEWEKEKAERRRLWEENRKAEAERAERQQKQQRLANWLQSRTEAWTDHTGTRPTSGQLERWQEEYVNGVAAEQERDLGRRLARAEDIAGS